MKSQKDALIEAIYQQIVSNEKAVEHFKKEFKTDDREFEKMVKKVLDAWLFSPELVMFLSETLGVFVGDEEFGDEEDADYLG
jgi:hypothetical protein